MRFLVGTCSLPRPVHRRRRPAAARRDSGHDRRRTGGVCPASPSPSPSRHRRQPDHRHQRRRRLPRAEPRARALSRDRRDPGLPLRAQNDVIVVGGIGVDFRLQAGAIAERIEVKSAAPDIQTEKAEVSAVVEQKKVDDLPLVRRNVLALAALQPGVNGIPGTADFLTAEQGIGVTANGVRQTGNSASVDGVSINDGPWGGTVLLVPNVEAVQEYQVIANNPSAEFGRNSGATVSIITKGGTNNFTGSVFEFHRNQDLRARGYFENRSIRRPISTARLRRQLRRADQARPHVLLRLGGNHPRAHRQLVQRDGRNAAARELRQTRRGRTRSRRGCSACSRRVAIRPPNCRTSARRCPARTCGARRRRHSRRRHDQRDQQRPATAIRSSAASITCCGMGATGSRVLLPVQHRDAVPLHAAAVQPSVSVQEPAVRPANTWVISNQTLNEVTFGYVRQHGAATAPGPESPDIGREAAWALRVGVLAPDRLHAAQLRGQEHADDEPRAAFVPHRRRGAARARRRDAASLGSGPPTRSSTCSTSSTTSRSPRTVRSTRDRPADDRLRHVRHQRVGRSSRTTGSRAPTSRSTSACATTTSAIRRRIRFPTTASSSAAAAGGRSRSPPRGSDRGAALHDRHQQHRAASGLTWDPRSSGRFVVRAGFGKSYNRINNTVFSDERADRRSSPRRSARCRTVAIVYSLGPDFAVNTAIGRGLDANGGIRGARVALRVVDPELQMPEDYNWFAGAQYQLPWNFMAEVNYNGTAGRKLLSGDGPTSEDYNRFSGDLLNDNVRNRLNPSFATVDFNESRTYSNYHGMSAQLQRRYATASPSRPPTPSACRRTCPAARWTSAPRSRLRRRRRRRPPQAGDELHLEAPYRPANRVLRAALGGWQLNAIAIMQSGTPFTVTCGWPGRAATSTRTASTTTGSTCRRRHRFGHPSEQEWLTGVMTATDFTNPAVMAFADQPRNAFRGPATRASTCRCSRTWTSAASRRAALNSADSRRGVQRLQLGQPEQPDRQHQQRQLRPRDRRARQAGRAARAEVDVLKAAIQRKENGTPPASFRRTGGDLEYRIPKTEQRSQRRNRRRQMFAVFENPVLRPRACYSPRNASTGSTDAARRAGT